MPSSLQSIGAYAPKHVLSNHDLEQLVDTNDEWIVRRTGIKTRHIAKEETTTDLAYNAAIVAIERSHINTADIDMVICSTLSPDYLAMPSTACMVADRLALKVSAFDINAACGGFIYLLQLAKSFIESGTKKNILIIAAEKMSSIIDYKDRTTCVLFGDGAGAAIVTNSDENNGHIIDVITSSDGSYRNVLSTPFNKKGNFLQMNGNEVFKFAVKTLCQDAKNILAKNNKTIDDIDCFISHQANLRIINAIKEGLGLADDKVITTVERFGNTSSASIPMALHVAYEEKLLQKGDLVLLNGLGGGFVWGSALLYYN